MDFTAILKTLSLGEPLSDDHLENAFDAILKGTLQPEQIGAFLMGLAVRGETSSELYAGAKVMRSHVKRINITGPVLDTCGTGGLGWTTLNTSTASAIVVASCGGKVAKHGNRSVPPKTGSADVLEALGVSLDVNESQFTNCIETAGVGFLFARTHHAAMKHVAPVRANLGIRTIFNLLGPLTNPSFASHQILGVYDPKWLEPMALTLQRLGITRAFVVHGETQEGRALDELSIAGASQVIEVTPDALNGFTVTPEQAGLDRHSIHALAGGSPNENALAIKEIFSGAENAFAASVSLNAGAGLTLLGLADNLEHGAELAQQSLRRGKAAQTLDTLIAKSNEN